MDFDLKYLEKLANIVYENDLSEITIGDDKKSVTFKREKPQPVINSSQPIISGITSQVVSMPAKKIQNEANEVKKKGKPITSPMVGTFYCSPSPEEPPFVTVGDNVSIGQVVCIVEAMKLMNEIEADASGKITEICVNNGDSIEFGQVLMYVE